MADPVNRTQDRMRRQIEVERHSPSTSSEHEADTLAERAGRSWRQFVRRHIVDDAPPHLDLESRDEQHQPISKRERLLLLGLYASIPTFWGLGAWMLSHWMAKKQ